MDVRNEAEGSGAGPAFVSGSTIARRLHEVLGGRNVLLVVALALSFTSTWLINTVAYPLTDPFAPQAQYLAPVVGSVVALAFAFACQYRPRLFTSGATVAFTMAFTVATSVLLLLSARWACVSLAVASAVLRWVGCILRDIVLGFALMGLSGPTCAGVLVCGYLLRYVLGLALASAPLGVLVVAFVVCFPAGLALLWPFARVSFARLHEAGTPADLSVTNPLSFLPSTGRMFVVVVMFHAALGFSVTFGGLGTALSPCIALLFFVALLAYALVRSRCSIDVLYTLSFLLTLAGLLLVPALSMGEGALSEVSSALCEISSSLFALVLWYLVARIGARSPAGALPVLCMVRSARGLGIALGLVGGMYATGAGLIDAFRIALFAAAVAFLFAGYNFVLARTFSFDATVRGIRPLEGVRVLAGPSPAGTGVARASVGDASGGAETSAAREPLASARGASGLDAACDALVRACRLTARESDVLRLLARGRNAAYIQQELSLTRSTVKSYVADVYRKLDVHSHQELIDLVEGQRPSGPGA